MVVVTDGTLSYTVFTYQCGDLNWVEGNAASIGFSASSTTFANHPLSRQANVNDIACLNQQCPPWSNVVYQINVEGKEVYLSIYSLKQLVKYIFIVFTVAPNPTPTGE